MRLVPSSEDMRSLLSAGKNCDQRQARDNMPSAQCAGKCALSAKRELKGPSASGKVCDGCKVWDVIFDSKS